MSKIYKSLDRFRRKKKGRERRQRNGKSLYMCIYNIPRYIFSTSRKRQRDVVCDNAEISSWRERRGERRRREDGDGDGDGDGNDDDGDGGGCILHRLYILFAHVNILGWFCSPLELEHIQINDITRTYACLLSLRGVRET